ncbi:thioesterase-like superfamily-domain-containing protein [Dactylonectria macrodidyma]|uniref:Thioesterase-like superfamily-domain-containing protein n=1 Tax=Dactylonectria macrodidyma TaxID=307937 RepID=A0A9P9IMJ2_9HYPO|nr:thioesterase-like superfamily-domain-containing protein [Dactylonectria macrodidyma]
MHSTHTKVFEDAITVVPLSSYTYSANLNSGWSIGDVPHGGYLAAVLYRLVCTHFKHNHPRRHAGHAAPISMQLSFVRRSNVGPAHLEVKEIKLGSRVSTVNVTLYQRSQSSSEQMVKLTGLVTISSLREEAGLSVPFNCALDTVPEIPTLTSCQTSKGAAAALWKLVEIPHPEFRKATGHVETYVRHKNSQAFQRHGISEQWTRLGWKQDDENVTGRWTNEAAAFLLDVFPSALAKLESQLQSEIGTYQPVWFPTLTMNIDFKKEIPEGGEEWLYSSVAMKQIKNGRTDIQVVLRDALGELIALASQAGLVMSSDRNSTGPQRTAPEKLRRNSVYEVENVKL